MSHTRKAYLRGTHRALPPHATFGNVSSSLRKYGITRIANITGMDRIGVPVYAVMRPNSRSLAVAQGKGIDDETARISGVMESIEVWHAENIHAPTVRASAAALSRENISALSLGMPLRKCSTFDRDTIIRWIEGVDLCDRGRKYYVPYHLVHTQFVLPPDDPNAHFCASSNGLASGNNFSEALVHALCEVIERDASALWHATPLNLTADRRVDPSTIDDEECLRVLEMLEAADMETVIWNITSDICVPAFRVEIVEQCINLPSYFSTPTYGEGCHPTRGIALLRAMTEACQSRLNLIIGSREDIGAEEYLTEGERGPEEIHRQHRVIEKRPQRFLDIPTYHNTTIEADLDTIIDKLQAADIAEAVCIRLDNGTDPNLAVVRVVVPGLEGVHDHPFYSQGKRAQALGGRAYR